MQVHLYFQTIYIYLVYLHLNCPEFIEAIRIALEKKFFKQIIIRIQVFYNAENP